MVTQKTTASEPNSTETFWELHKLDQKGSSAFMLDAREVDDVIELTAEVPGVERSDIEVNLEGDILTISLEKRAQDDAKRIHFSERSYGRFKRSIQVPFAPDADSVTAEVQNGLLVIRFPRTEADRTRRIAIRETGADTGQEHRAIGATWEGEPGTNSTLTLTDVAGRAPSDAAVENSATRTDVKGASRKLGAQSPSQLTPADWQDAVKT
jgi:HSP20 family protein